MVVIKFRVKDQSNPKKLVYRWDYCKPIGTIKYYDVIRKLHESTNSKYFSFVLKWFDGVDMVMITDTRSLQDALRELSLKNTKDKCARLEVTALTETNLNEPPPSYDLSTTASSSNSVPTTPTVSVSRHKKSSVLQSCTELLFNPISHKR